MPPDPDDKRIRLTREVDALCDEYEAILRGGDPPALTPYLERIPPSGRKKLLKELLSLAIEHLCKRGEIDPAAWIQEANPDLVQEIEPLLGRSAETATYVSNTGAHGRGLHVRCPHCHNPIELVPDAELESIQCHSCGSDFSLVTDGHNTREAVKVSNVAHFQFVERVGIGAFGSVWKAYDTKLDRTVAVKIPRKGQFDSDQEKKFFREAQSVAQLNHPGIVPVHEVGRDGDILYIVSDYVRGLTLADWLSSQQPTVRDSVELCVKICAALHHAHERGVVHRDLKPANIMLDAENRPYLMDFGLAKREAIEVTMSLDGQVLGTPAYMSPEQALGEGYNADRRSDVYSLGVILFQLLTGELPFRGNSRMLIHQVIHDDPPSPRKLNAGVPKDLETITLACLEKDVSRRYGTAQEVLEELERWLRNEPIERRPLGVTGRAYRWAMRNKTTAALASTIAASLFTGALVSTGFAITATRNAAIAIRSLEVVEETNLLSQQLSDSQMQGLERWRFIEEDILNPSHLNPTIAQQSRVEARRAVVAYRLSQNAEAIALARKSLESWGQAWSSREVADLITIEITSLTAAAIAKSEGKNSRIKSECRSLFETVVDSWRSIQRSYPEDYSSFGLIIAGEAFLSIGDVDRAEELLREGWSKQTKDTRYPQWRRRCGLILSELVQNSGAVDEAKQIRSSAELVKKSGVIDEVKQIRSSAKSLRHQSAGGASDIRSNSSDTNEQASAGIARARLTDALALKPGTDLGIRIDLLNKSLSAWSKAWNHARFADLETLTGVTAEVVAVAKEPGGSHDIETRKLIELTQAAWESLKGRYPEDYRYCGLVNVAEGLAQVGMTSRAILLLERAAPAISDGGRYEESLQQCLSLLEGLKSKVDTPE